MKRLLTLAAIAAAVAFAPLARAADLEIKLADTIESVISSQKGKKVTIRTRSGLEVTGTVKVVTGGLVHVAQLAGKEFYDAVVPVAAVDAVIVRTKD